MVDALIWPLAEELLSLWYFCLRGSSNLSSLIRAESLFPPTPPLSALNNDAVLISAVSLICLFAVNYLLLFFLVIVLSVLWCFFWGGGFCHLLFSFSFSPLFYCRPLWFSGFRSTFSQCHPDRLGSDWRYCAFNLPTPLHVGESRILSRLISPNHLPSFMPGGSNIEWFVEEK